MPRTVTLTIRLTESDRAQVTETAKRLNMTDSEFARKCLVKDLTQLYDDIHCMHFRIRALEEAIQEMEKFTLGTLAAVTLYVFEDRFNDSPEEKTIEVKKYLSAVMELGTKIKKLKFKV